MEVSAVLANTVGNDIGDIPLGSAMDGLWIFVINRNMILVEDLMKCISSIVPMRSGMLVIPSSRNTKVAHHEEQHVHIAEHTQVPERRSE